ncbi:YcnI family protein [Streptomyces sp. TS71-3]|uniref:YcnI family copper-binding membrane protein n=1 Tax=Streptomyces sp. TS71-3 TaxID=2733862 RepID=UPI001B08717C|nr:YcnI family protein [Streptomyces sp. TS71-3]GHJ40176.1 membrane protein [Streptomyces sp. TS71-3]
MKVSRVTVVGATAAFAVLGLSAPAFAHVTVAPEGQAAKGGYAVLDFKVPNERDNASTTKLEVSFPYQQHPLASVAPQPVPGWTIKITKSKLSKPLKSEDGTIDEAVSKVTWTADGKGIEPGYFQKFPVSVGKLPEDADALMFKALQTYSNHEVVRWIEEQQKGQPEPENPAPSLQLTAAPAEDGQSGARSASDDKSGATKESTAAAGDSGGSDTTARVLGIIGIVVGVLGVAFGVLAGRRRTTS